MQIVEEYIQTHMLRIVTGFCALNHLTPDRTPEIEYKTPEQKISEPRRICLFVFKENRLDIRAKILQKHPPLQTPSNTYITHSQVTQY